MNPDGQKSQGSLALSLSQGLVDPKVPRDSQGSKGQLVNIPALSCSKTDAFGTIVLGSRPVESRKLVDAVTAGSERTAEQRKSGEPGAREKASAVSVPRSDTGVLAEKAKA